MMRRRGPGLVRTMGRTAVIAGTATAVAGGVASRQGQKAAAAQQQATAPQYAAPAPVEVVPDGIPVEQLEQLAALHTSGVLSDEEFQAAKSKLLGL
jgi:hypothetical protein